MDNRSINEAFAVEAANGGRAERGNGEKEKVFARMWRHGLESVVLA